MDILFENDAIFETCDLNEYLIQTRAATIQHFEDQLKDNGLVIEHMRDSYLVQLNEFIDESDCDYQQKNDENKSLFDESLEQKAKLIQQKYSLAMNESALSLVRLEDLEDIHKEFMSDLLAKFNDDNESVDRKHLVPHQEKLRSFMENDKLVHQNLLTARIQDIIKSYETISSILKEQYLQDMMQITKSDEIFAEDDFDALHEVNSNAVINLFEQHLMDNPCADDQTYLIGFRTKITEEFKRTKQLFESKRVSNLNALTIAIQEFTEEYEKQMKANEINIKTKDNLKECHEKVKNVVINRFEKTYRFRNNSQIIPYIEKLVENFGNLFNDFETLLEFKIDKREQLTKNLKLDIRRFYREEMQKIFQNQMFVKKAVLIQWHKLVVKNTLEKYSQEKDDLDDKSFKQLVEHSVEDIYKKINEDNQTNRPTDSAAIGIDLGTTNSCVAYYKPESKNSNNVVVIPNEFGHLTTPSVVSYRNNSIINVGDVPKDEIHVYPRNTITSVKRLIGRHYSDENVQNDLNLWSYKVVDDGNNNPKISVKVDEQDVILYPEQVSAKILKKMKEIAEDHLGFKVSKAVITVPAYFNDGQKEATKDAGRLAGLEVLRIINEPTAAAIAFKVDRNEETEIRNVLIFDFGGGTFDVSILEINRGIIDVKAVGGDNHLGGDDIDTNLIKYCLEQFENESGLRLEDIEGESAMCRLRNKCEEQKKKLTAVESTIILIESFYKRQDLRVPLTRDKFEELNYGLFVKSIDLVKSTLEGKEINPSVIDDIVLVGGTTRIPKIQEMLSEFFGGRPLNHWVNPDEAVAKGAAIKAAYINGQIAGSTDLELKDVTPLSLGIRIKGGKMSVIIPRNSPVPNTFTKQYYTSEAYQTVVGIKIFEGEKDMANDNHLLGQFDLSGIPRAPQGDQPIDVTISLNEEGLLQVKAKIVSTGGENEIEILEHKGRLTDEIMEQLIEEENCSQLCGNMFN